MQDQQYNADDAANLTGLGYSLPGWVHPAGSHFLQVIAAHYPCDNAADEAANNTQYSKSQDEAAAMRPDRLLCGVLGPLPVLWGPAFDLP